MLNFVRKAFSPIFFARLAVGAVLGVASAASISFLVADYVAKANIDTINDRMSGLDSRVSHVDQSGQDQMAATRSDLSRQLEALISRLDQTNINLGNLNGSVGGLTATVDDLNKRVEESNLRQVEFERFVTSILIRQAPPQIDSTAINASWGVELSEDELQHLDISPEKVESLLRSFE